MENEERGETSVSRRLFSLTLKNVNADRGCVLELLKCFEKESPNSAQMNVMKAVPSQKQNEITCPWKALQCFSGRIHEFIVSSAHDE